MYSNKGRRRKWRCFCMGNPNLVPYETIVRAISGKPEAVDECSCTVKKQATENKRQTASTTLFRTKKSKDQKTSIVEMCITGYGIMDNSVHSTWKR